ncbi:MAG: inorganic pyrophosphatase [Flavobacteriales bacterium]
MGKNSLENLWKNIGMRYKAHPWHGLSAGENAPEEVNAFIEVVPSDSIKYEIDKESGYMMVDRPQKFSNHFPALYGFVPKTFCDEKVAELSRARVGRDDIDGDQDPVDICILTERNINHGNIIVPCTPIGGFRMLDGGEADDKIIAVMKGDSIYGDYTDATDLPKAVLDRLKHYFLTYKEIPGESNEKPKIEITHLYGKAEAMDVIKRSMDDYDNKYGNVEEFLKDELTKVVDHLK